MRFLWLLFLFVLLPRAWAEECVPAELKAGDHCRVEIWQLRPTQPNVGMVDVLAKQDEIRDLSEKKREEYFAKHPAIVVIGPGGKMYMVDRHHTTRAAYLEGVREMDVEVLANLSDLTPSQFSGQMDAHHWVRHRNAEGKFVPLADIPHHVRDLPDDPYRSLAWVVRKSEAFLKSPVPFAEFDWADFLRERIPPADLANWHEAVKKAIALATTTLASHLPGHSPVADEEREKTQTACYLRFAALRLPNP